MVPKVHLYMNDPIQTPLWGYMGVQSSIKRGIVKHCIETIMGGNSQGFYVISHTKFKIFLNSLITEKTENFLQIYFLEILKLDFPIPGQILSGNLVQHIFQCLVTSVTPQGVMGVTKHQNMCRTKNSLKILPGIGKSSFKIS